VGLLLSVPLAVILYLQSSSANERALFNSRERTGVAYLAPVNQFLHQLQLRRILAAAVLEGETNLKAALDQATVRADDAAVQVDAIDSRLGSELGTTEEWRSIRNSWNKLKENPLTGARDVDLDHGQLTTSVVHRLLRRVVNNSNLILDPDLDSYWLMDALAIKLPSLAEAVSRATATSLATPCHGDVRLDRTIDLASDYRLEITTITDVIQVNMATAFRETQRFGQSEMLKINLEAPSQTAAQAVKHHAEMLRQELQEQVEPKKRSYNLITGAKEALSQVYELGKRIGPDLDRLIEKRIRHYRARRTQGLIAAAAAAAVLSYLFIAIYLSIRNSVSAIRNEHPSDSRSEAGPPSKDEIGQIAVAYTKAQGEKSKLEEQLRLAERLATIGTLAAGTAHELNDPLEAILGFAQLATKSSGLPESTQRDLGKITRAALHARDVIKKLLLFARQTPPKKAPLDLRQVVQEALEFLQPRFDQAAVSLMHELKEVPPVLADASQVRQLVLNLLVNALQATKNGGKVQTTLQVENGRASLTVRDNGCGMSEEVQKQVFLPFYTTKEVGQGTGLGLSVAHGIVTAHNGTIEVESSPGSGSRFKVEFPLFEGPHRG
jgi:signal transduction histidine kinase